MKLVAFALAIWFCIAFLVYTDDTRRRAAQEGAGASGAGSAPGVGGGAGGLGDPIALALRNEPAGEDFGINGNVIGGGGQKQAHDEADIPPTVGKHKADLQAERMRKKAAEQPKKKPQEGESSCFLPLLFVYSKRILYVRVCRTKSTL